MVSVVAEKTIAIQCRVKYDIWGEDMTLGELPTSFLELVKLFSKLFFPNNFSISYVDTNFNLQPIDGAPTYRELISVINKSDMKEIRFLVNIFKETFEGKTKKNNKTNRKSSTTKSNTFKDAICAIKELSEHSSGVSEEAISVCSAKTEGDDDISLGKIRKEKRSKKEKTIISPNSCISCY
jgi:hypothetical protein